MQLPLDRVRESAIFEITGIDLCGPLLLKPRGKARIVLFTCAVYRAIHLEPLTSLSTESFMQTLRRFICPARPSINDDSDELIPLTPSLFLQDIKQVGVPDLDSVDTNKLNVRVNHCNTLRSELRSRFRKEYSS
ncbi:integrase catalytic domain-containing protein [Caerostris extrusa]|uniref:Integrase catalytic domain-containing protein n=1 Tax=Caerostris extrusa TaxID=172846 RepID=A0AAV4XNB7_CAEEX|nr:integrase catalytic domain-containing protein [Caerostris extrusa]